VSNKPDYPARPLPKAEQVKPAVEVKNACRRAADRQCLGGAVPGHDAHGVFSKESPKSTKSEK
jgi:hypothetical protein